MKPKEYREKSVDELRVRATDLKAELFNLRFQHFTGQLENSMKIRDLKRDIARLLTIIGEKEQAAGPNPTSAE
ncbi:MAG: 50S ribosomal protein L29 [Deltaproteobacteria bacterium]|nr:50S ribosomal protein L29 [Deltaproteobacteria bacterium]